MQHSFISPDCQSKFTGQSPKTPDPTYNISSTVPVIQPSLPVTCKSVLISTFQICQKKTIVLKHLPKNSAEIIGVILSNLA